MTQKLGQKQELSTLSLARRAGKLILGFDKVKEEMEAGHVEGLFYSSDLSEKSRKELCFIAQKHQLEPMMLDITMDEMLHACGKRSGVIALADKGFAKKIASYAKPSAAPQPQNGDHNDL